MGILTPVRDSSCYQGWDWDKQVGIPSPVQPHELRVRKKHGTTHWLPSWDLARVSLRASPPQPPRETAKARRCFQPREGREQTLKSERRLSRGGHGHRKLVRTSEKEGLRGAV